MKNFFNKYKYQIILSIIVFMLFLTNYKTGTYLLGWDSLQTDLDPWLAVKRAFFSVWEEYQSLGLTAGMAHATDLVRALFLLPVSFIIPQNMVRYFYHFLMVFIGGWGAFGLFGLLTKNKKISFFGALFYILNLGTVQIFFLPFEPFSTFFAFLPWSIWSFINTTWNVERGINKKNLLLFFLINVFGTPSFYTQQLFVVYILILGCISLGHPKGVQTRKIFYCFLLIFLINSFWLLPQIYYLKTSHNWISQAKINQISTQDTFYQNLAKGTLDNFLTLRGFYFDLLGMKNHPLFSTWKTHISTIFGGLSYFFAGIIVLGLINDIRKKRYLFFFIFLLCALALIPATIPFSWINMFLRQSSLVNQIFRSPFTKFIIPYVLVYSYFFIQGLSFIKTVFKKEGFLFLFVILVALYSLPSFEGFFISPEMKVKIPSDYFQIINYFKNENKNQRIALLPDYTYWGWFLNKWGYNGSGFLWYGIEQPIISRTFDVWSPISEGYYWEEKQAIEAENLSKFESVLDKYEVNYILVDYSLKPVVTTYKSLQYDRIDNLLSQSKKIALVTKGENVALFKVRHSQETKDFVAAFSDLPNIGPEIKLTTEDRAYYENGVYQTKANEAYNFYYPFLDLMTQTKNQDRMWKINESNQNFSVSVKLTASSSYKNFVMPTLYQASIFDKGASKNFKLNLNKDVEDEKITISFEKSLIESFNVNTANKNNNELGFSASYLPQKYSYLVKLKTKNIKGSPFFFYIIDDTKKQSVLEATLDENEEYFIIPSKYNYGLGYTFVFQTKDYRNYPSENSIDELSIYLFPYEALKQAKFIKNNSIQKTNHQDFQAIKINYFTYKVSASSGIVVLNQAYDPGWIAIADEKILKHIKVNNWANGWLLNNVTKQQGNNVTIIFWPQYLQFLGFGLLIIAFLIIIFKYDTTLPPTDKKS